MCSFHNSNIRDKSSGIMWVGVHGMDSICVVTRSEDLDPTRLRGSLKHFWPIHEILFQFRKSVIVEIEDLADPSSEIRERFHMRIKKPFGVVSVIPGVTRVVKEEVMRPQVLSMVKQRPRSFYRRK